MIQSDLKIDFFVIGVQKSATTWIYHCLKDHKHLYIGGNKVEKFYLGGEEFQNRGIQWFSSLFNNSNSHKAIGSVSVDYIHDENAIPFIKKYSTVPKFIVSFRDPVQRSVSICHWLYRTGQTATKSINKVLDRALHDYKDGKTNIYSKIIQRGLYAHQIEKYLREFSHKQFKFVIYDDIVSRPLDVLRDMYSFLNVDTLTIPISFYRKPKATNSNPLILYFARLFNQKRILHKFFAGIIEVSAKLSHGKKQIGLDEIIMRELNAIYKPEIKKLIKIIDDLEMKSKPISGISSVLKWNN